MGAPMTLEVRGPVGSVESAASVGRRPKSRGRLSRWSRAAAGLAEDVALVLLAALALPVAILMAGSVIALFVWVFLEIGQRLLA